MKRGSIGFRSSILLAVLLVIVGYLVLNNVYMTDSTYSYDLTKTKCIKGVPSPNITDSKFCKSSCASEFEPKIRADISCKTNSTTAVCKCGRTLYNTYIKSAF